METLTDDRLELVFAKYRRLEASLNLVESLRDPVISDCPMLLAASRVRKMTRGFLVSIDEDKLDANLSLLQESWDILMPPLQAFIERQRLLQFDMDRLNTSEFRGIPELDQDGLLPPGMHHASWQEFVDRFGNSDRRRRQTQGLLAALHLLRQVGCRQVHIGGSFVTAKEDPTDIDYIFLADGVDFMSLEPMLDRRNTRSRGARLHFGLDGGEGSLYSLRTKRQHRTVFDMQTVMENRDQLDHLQPIPTDRFVGTVALDLQADLPPASDFSPGYMWDDPTTRMELFGRM